MPHEQSVINNSRKWIKLWNYKNCLKLFEKSNLPSGVAETDVGREFSDGISFPSPAELVTLSSGMVSDPHINEILQSYFIMTDN